MAADSPPAQPNAPRSRTASSTSQSSISTRSPTTRASSPSPSTISHASSNTEASTSGSRSSSVDARGSIRGTTGKTSTEQCLDVTIKFCSASGLPVMDAFSRSADPYFIANLNGQITYTSNVKVKTQAPVWDEEWTVRNVHQHSTLQVQLLDWDRGSQDEEVGQFSINASAHRGMIRKEMDIKREEQVKGKFVLEITCEVSKEDKKWRLYTFDGPVRFTRSSTSVVGYTTQVSDERGLWYTWMVRMKGIYDSFGNVYQIIDPSRTTAKTAYGVGLSGKVVRATKQFTHSTLYSPGKNDLFGPITSGNDFLSLLRTQSKTGLGPVKLTRYTYVIADDDTLRFSETGVGVKDNVSKHAMHTDCNDRVRFAGEFHPRPKGGWEKFDDRRPDSMDGWELVFDNNSGTYSPDSEKLSNVKRLLEYNFPGINVVTIAHTDNALTQSRSALEARTTVRAATPSKRAFSLKVR